MTATLEPLADSIFLTDPDTGEQAAVTAAHGLEVDVTRSALPADASTETTLAALKAAIDAVISGGAVKIDAQDTDFPDTASLAKLEAIRSILAGSVAIGGTVAVSNFPATQPISATSLPLPSGAATSAKQDSQAALFGGGLPAALGAGGGLKVDGSGTALPMSATSLPLPSGAATGAKQDTIIALLGGSGAPTQVWKSANATTQQTGTVVWDPASGKAIAITHVLVATYGVTAGRLILYLAAHGDTTYTEGTDQPVVKASFAPSTASAPGLVMALATPILAPADYELMYTTDAALSVDIVVYGYEFTP